MKVQLFTYLGFVMNRTTVHKYRLVVVQSVISVSLEKRLSHRQQRQIIEAIPDFMVAVQSSLFTRLLHVLNKLRIQTKFCNNTQKNLNWHFDLFFHEYTYSVIINSAAYRQPFFFFLKYPRLLHFSHKIHHLLVLIRQLSNQLLYLIFISRLILQQVEVDLLQQRFNFGYFKHAFIDVVFSVRLLQRLYCILNLVPFLEFFGFFLLQDMLPHDLLNIVLLEIKPIATGRPHEAMVIVRCIVLRRDRSVSDGFFVIKIGFLSWSCTATSHNSKEQLKSTIFYQFTHTPAIRQLNTNKMLQLAGQSQHNYEDNIRRPHLSLLKVDNNAQIHRLLLLIPAESAHQLKQMGKGSTRDNMIINNKRVTGNKIMYELQSGREKDWIPFQELTEHLQLVIQYEKKRKERIQGYGKRITKMNTTGKPINIEIDEDTNNTEQQKANKENVEKGKEGKAQKQVLDILFQEKKKGLLYFKVYFMDTTFKIMDNNQLKDQYPLRLLEFYQNNIHVSFK